MGQATRRDGQHHEDENKRTSRKTESLCFCFNAIGFTRTAMNFHFRSQVRFSGDGKLTRNRANSNFHPQPAIVILAPICADSSGAPAESSGYTLRCSGNLIGGHFRGRRGEAEKPPNERSLRSGTGRSITVPIPAGTFERALRRQFSCRWKLLFARLRVSLPSPDNRTCERKWRFMAVRVNPIA